MEVLAKWTILFELFSCVCRWTKAAEELSPPHLNELFKEGLEALNWHSNELRKVCALHMQSLANKRFYMESRKSRRVSQACRD